MGASAPSFALQVWAVLMELLSAFKEELEALKIRGEQQLGRTGSQMPFYAFNISSFAVSMECPLEAFY